MILCGLLIILLASPVKGKDINWKSEILKAERLFEKAFNVRDIDAIVKDFCAPGFLRITPNAVIGLNVSALNEHWLGRRRKETVKNGPLNIISTCGNVAMTWHKLACEEVVQDACVIAKGSSMTLYEYLDGRAKAKFAHIVL